MVSVTIIGISTHATKLLVCNTCIQLPSPMAGMDLLLSGFIHSAGILQAPQCAHDGCTNSGLSSANLGCRVQGRLQPKQLGGGGGTVQPAALCLTLKDSFKDSRRHQRQLTAHERASCVSIRVERIFSLPESEQVGFCEG